MKTILFNLFLTATIFTIAAHQTSVHGQKVTIKPFAVNSSTLLEDLKTLKTSNPKLPIGEFVKNANALLQKRGLNFSFAFDAGVCQKIEELRKKTTDSECAANS